MIVLASQSITRRQLLERAGINFDVRSPSVDENAEKAKYTTESATFDLATHLAQLKALAVSADFPRQLIIGADQTLFCAGRFFDKPGDKRAAREQLQLLRGQTHILTSAVSCAKDNSITWTSTEKAYITFRDFSDAVLDRYLDEADPSICNSVGAYHYEGIGIRLIENVEGRDDVILGMPVFPLLSYLRSVGLAAK